jgi:hypothetical protein
MEPLSMNDVETFEARTTGWYDDYGNPESVNTRAQTEMAAVREQAQLKGISLITDASLREYESQWRERRDKEGATSGALLEADKLVLEQRIGDAIEKAATLPSASEQYGASTTTYLQAQMLDEMRHARALREIDGLTRAQLRDRYLATRDDDESARAFVRLVESAVLGQSVDRLGLKDDPDHDVIAVRGLFEAVNARRATRVPEWLVDARARVTKAWTLKMAFALGHLRAGRGIAHTRGVA